MQDRLPIHKFWNFVGNLMCLQNICCRIDEGNYTVCILHMSYSDDVKDIPYLAL